MHSYFIKYVKKISLLTFIVGLLIILAFFLLPKVYTGKYIPLIVLFFYLFNIIVHYVLLKLSSKKMARFTAYFMASTLLKLMVYFGIMLWYAFMNKSNAVNFIIAFFVVYLIYTFFEVMSLQSFAKKVK